MLKTLCLLGSIVFLVFLTIAFQERNMMYKKYPTSCFVTYIPEKEKINIISSPYEFNIEENRRLELLEENTDNLKEILFKKGFTIKEIEDIYSIRYNKTFDEYTNDEIINIIMDIEQNNFNKKIPLKDYLLIQN